MIPPESISPQFKKAIANLKPNPYLAALLWQRGIRDLSQIAGFLNPKQYTPTIASAFGLPMERSALRIQQAIDQGESIALWPDCTPDGIVSVALIWDGLSSYDRIQIVRTGDRRLLSSVFDSLRQQGVSLVITCGIDSQNPVNIEYANAAGLDLIMINHHTDDRSDTFAHLNSRHLERDHPFATLPSVAIAYKLMEAVLKKEPEHLLDLVAIGMLSDRVEFVGETRYLFQISIPKLQAQSHPNTATRPGILKLLEYCKQRGDRPTSSISGLNARIRTFCQIQPGDCLDLLIAHDQAQAIADQVELAHVRLLALHQEVLDQVLVMVRALDLSMGEAIVLVNSQWDINALPSVADAIAERFQRTTFLLTTEESGIAKGVGRSSLNLHSLLRSQQYLLNQSIGHPNAINLSLPSENLEIFVPAMQHQLRLQSFGIQTSQPFDLCVTVAELDQNLYEAIRSIEPIGCNESVPCFLIKNVRFDNVFTKKIKDYRHNPVIYRCVEFKLCDQTATDGIHGNWWGHSQDELPKEACDAIVQLENNVAKKRYEVRLLDWFSVNDRPVPDPRSALVPQPLSLDDCLSETHDFKTLLGIAKYLARTGEKVSMQQWCDRLCISNIMLQVGFDVLQELGFTIVIRGNSIAISRSSLEPPTSEVLTKAAKHWERSLKYDRFRPLNVS